MQSVRAYRSVSGEHELELVRAGERLLAERCRVSVGGVDVAGAMLRAGGRRLHGELPDGRAVDVDITEGVALRGGHVTLIVDGQVLPLREEPAAGPRDIPPPMH